MDVQAAQGGKTGTDDVPAMADGAHAKDDNNMPLWAAVHLKGAANGVTVRSIYSFCPVLLRFCLGGAEEQPRVTRKGVNISFVTCGAVC